MTIEIVFLGTGAAEGIPVIGCSCDICKKSIKKSSKNIRTRTSILLKEKNGNILFDVSPDIRSQLIKNNIYNLNYIFLSHWHFDHFGGIPDFMYWNRHSSKRKRAVTFMNKFCINNYSNLVENLFIGEVADKYRPFLEIKELTSYKSITINSFTITPIDILHIEHTFGFLIKINDFKIVYIPDTKIDFPKETKKLLFNANIGIIEATSFENLDKHLTVDQAATVSNNFKWTKTYFVGISHKNLAHKELQTYLNRNFKGSLNVAFDNLRIEIEH